MMGFLDDLQQLATRYRHYRRQIVTERMIGGLPPEIRKDIGWPEASDDKNRSGLLARH